MKPRIQIVKQGSPKGRSYYRWDLGSVAFGKDEEPRGHNGGMKKGKKEN